MKRTFPTIAALFAATLSLPCAAGAHVQVFPDPNNREAAACSYGKFVVRVPTEKPIPTVRVTIVIPPAVTVVAAQPKAGWNVSFTTSKGRIVAIDWSGGALLPHQFDEFAFLAQTPKTAGSVSWNAMQYYADGSVVNWNGAPGSENPHSQTTITAADCKRK